jgi:hypothetical protein
MIRSVTTGFPSRQALVRTSQSKLQSANSQHAFKAHDTPHQSQTKLQPPVAEMQHQASLLSSKLKAS